MRVLYLKHRSGQRKPRRDAGLAGATGVSLNRLLARSDYVSIHVPLTEKTSRMIGAREFALMKPGAILINTSRGAVVDQAAMVGALKSGRLAGAGLDVTDPRADRTSGSAASARQRSLITPHIGSASIAARASMAAIAADNILDVFAGRLPRRCANPQVHLRHPK